MNEIFTSLAAVMVLAALGGIAAKIFKQPVMLGYLLAGLGLVWWWPDSTKHTVELMGQLGLTLLLVLVVLEFHFVNLKKM
jgi:CPA2 family monovalent cation:H+ antiporter-2